MSAGGAAQHVLKPEAEHAARSQSAEMHGPFSPTAGGLHASCPDMRGCPVAHHIGARDMASSTPTGHSSEPALHGCPVAHHISARDMASSTPTGHSSEPALRGCPVAHSYAPGSSNV